MLYALAILGGFLAWATLLFAAGFAGAMFTFWVLR